MLEKTALDKTARLARIGLNEKEIELFTPQLNKIVDYFANLKSLNLKDIKPTSHIINITCPRRQDKKIRYSDEVLTKLPWVKFRHFFVPIILDALSE